MSVLWFATYMFLHLPTLHDEEILMEWFIPGGSHILSLLVWHFHCKSLFLHLRWPLSVFTFSQTQRQEFEMIHGKIIIIWKAVGGSHSLPQHTLFSSFPPESVQRRWQVQS